MNKNETDMEMNIGLIELFGVTISDNAKHDYNEFIELNKESIPCGYFISPEACNPYTRYFVNHLVSNRTNYNATFYKEWQDVISKNRAELFLDQCMHYFSTYGLNFDIQDNGYVPNDGADVPDYTPQISQLKIIKICSEKDLYERCFKMVSSGIAIKQDVIKPICEYICEYSKQHSIAVDIDAITNREALAWICEKLNVLPSDKFNLFRYIIYVTTGKTMIIQNEEMINDIKCSLNPFDFTKLSEKNINNLSSIFRRFKNLFLAFKHNHVYSTKMVEVCAIINKMARLAKHTHTPLQVGVWENVLTKKYPITTLKLCADKLTPFKALTLMQTIREKTLAQNGNYKNMYLIRNGKMFVKDNNKDFINNCSDVNYYTSLYQWLESYVISKLSKKACVVKFPENYVLTCPTSEKNFVGNLPFGTYYEMGEENFFGIYWRNAWGTNDFDLSFTDLNGDKIGWDAEYKYDKNRVMFSGDMVNADPEATEVLYCDVMMPNGVIKVNRFRGEEGSKFKIFFGSQKIRHKNFHRGYMVDPNCIKMEDMLISHNREQSIGIINDGKAYVINIQTGNKQSTHCNPADMYNIFAIKAKSFINLKDILLKAGFKEYDEKKVDEYNENNTNILDLTQLNKDTLISLFV